MTPRARTFAEGEARARHTLEDVLEGRDKRTVDWSRVSYKDWSELPRSTRAAVLAKLPEQQAQSYLKLATA
jgi:hypothetical protein